ncbi:MAG: class I SAM-dependent methyltransferase [Thermoleophilia bacterium]|nr:class I SAM-dependent methyltransferase [Thermoleophilia bacterium]
MRETERAGLHERRRVLLAQARGDVLEIGSGTGANSDFFDSAWTSLTLVEPSAAMASKLRAKLAQRDGEGAGPRVIEAPAERLPLPDDSVDTAISTLVLCTVGDPDAALAELHRVLRPGGKLLFMEHVRSDKPRTARWQDRLRGPWKVFGNGCTCNRDTEQAIKRAGFAIESLEHGSIPKAPPIVRPLIQGSATR